MAQLSGILVALGLLLTSCGDGTDDAYQRGYDDGLHDGWVDTCNEIARFSSSIEDILKAQRIC
jgi:hypothetical protein